ncbi:MAG: hypothetical protein H7A53_11605 [Akkermansiaceae bacterium]|nr:hypothetical protein [Akkermansiaceae bacterium]
MRIRLASALLLLTPLLMLGVLGLFVAGMVTKNRETLIWTVGGIGVLLLVWLLALALTRGVNCTVCANPVFQVKGCRLHARARRFLGVSHRLGVAVWALFRNRFYCMYCGERIPLGGPPRTVRQAEMPAPAKGPVVFEPVSASELPEKQS